MINKYIIIVEMEDFTTFFLILICITIFYAYLENKKRVNYTSAYIFIMHFLFIN